MTNPDDDGGDISALVEELIAMGWSQAEAMKLAQDIVEKETTNDY